MNFERSQLGFDDLQYSCCPRTLEEVTCKHPNLLFVYAGLHASNAKKPQSFDPSNWNSALCDRVHIHMHQMLNAMIMTIYLELHQKPAYAHPRSFRVTISHYLLIPQTLAFSPYAKSLDKSIYRLMAHSSQGIPGGAKSSSWCKLQVLSVHTALLWEHTEPMMSHRILSLAG